MGVDKTSFTTLKRDKYGSSTFGNDNSSKILGQGTLELWNGAPLAKHVLLVENMSQSSQHKPNVWSRPHSHIQIKRMWNKEGRLR